MNRPNPARSLALVLSRLGGQARTRLIEGLSTACREDLLAALEHVELLGRTDVSFAEQVLSQELDVMVGDNESVKQDNFREAYSLRVADVIALLLLKGSADHAGSILSHLPHSTQAECVHAIAAQDWEAVETHLGVEERQLIAAIDAWLGGGERHANPEMAVEMLKNINTPRQLRALLTHIHHRDSEVAKQILSALFSVEDLRRLTDRELQTLTTGLDDWDLAIAILAMSDGLRRRILANVSQRRAAFLEDDAAYLDDTDEEEIQSVCERILVRVRMLYEQGDVQTYLGSVSAEPVDPDAEEEEKPSGPRKLHSTVVDEPEAETKRSRRPIVFGVVGLGLLALAWSLGIGDGRRPPRSRSRVSASDFASGQRAEVGGAGINGRTKEGAGSGVTASDGEVYVVSGDSRAPISDAPIQSGDIVETGKGGQALISLTGDDGWVELEEDSALQVGEEGEKMGTPRMTLRLGHVWVLSKSPALEVHSPLVSVTAASGTLYRFHVVLSSATSVSVERGTAWVKQKVGDKELIVVGEGKSLRVHPRGSSDLTEIGDAGRPRWLSFFDSF